MLLSFLCLFPLLYSVVPGRFLPAGLGLGVGGEGGNRLGGKEAAAAGGYSGIQQQAGQMREAGAIKSAIILIFVLL